MLSDPFFNIVLVHPEIPSNTGNIGRTCVGFLSALHLIEPLGFEINDKRLKRAGLDYWPSLNYIIYPQWQDIQKKISSKRVFYMSTKGKKNLYNHPFKKGDWFVFGAESKGLGEILSSVPSQNILTIPSPGPIRSLNLANAVSITLFEAYRCIKC